MAWPDQNSRPPKRLARRYENSRQPDQTQIGTPSWQIGTLRYLRVSTATPLAAKRKKSKGKDCGICEGIRIPSELLQARTVRHLRERAGRQMMRPMMAIDDSCTLYDSRRFVIEFSNRWLAASIHDIRLNTASGERHLRGIHLGTSAMRVIIF
jgi:hypothetical protein